MGEVLGVRGVAGGLGVLGGRGAAGVSVFTGVPVFMGVPVFVGVPVSPGGSGGRVLGDVEAFGAFGLRLLGACFLAVFGAADSRWRR
ncbi:hypothetical protein [Streptosporangium canum]|uniref:hypothetical protein n=1 Tax=Streptosporangium canum TaxID=324952 RepID=UPI00342F105F